MQKKVFASLSLVFIIALILTTISIYVIQTNMAHKAANDTCDIFLADVKNILVGNDKQINELKGALKEDYICRARALAEIIALEPDVINDFDRLVELQTRLDVDEIHIMDKDGILNWGTVKDWYGYDFASADQTIPFLEILKDPELEIAQDPMTSGVGVLRQYIGVARKDDIGFVQVGLLPSRLEKALRDTTIDKVLGNIHVGDTGYIFSSSLETGIITYHPNDLMIGSVIDEVLTGEAADDGIFTVIDGLEVFYKSADYGDNIIYAVIPKDEMYESRTFYTGIYFMFSLLLLGLSCLIIMFFLKRNVINGILGIVGTLKEITSGNLDITVEERSNKEFISLSDGINTMLSSIKTKIDEVAEKHKIIVSSIDYASKIQRNLLPKENVFKRSFSDYSVIWKPRDIVGGDIYWIKNYDEGSVLCVCDCTGHGTPGALLTMVVVSTFEMTVNECNYKDTAQIVWELDKQLVSVLNVGAKDEKPDDLKRKTILDIHDGCDLAVVFIGKDGTVNISTGNMHVFVCDGEAVSQYKGQRIRVGEGTIKCKEDIKVTVIPHNPNNRFYIASDGLYDQLGGDKDRPFGYGTFKKIILEHHNENQAAISDFIWKAFEEYKGAHERVDDFELITFKI